VSDITIKYEVELDNQNSRAYEITLDPDTIEQKLPSEGPVPDWALLHVEKCKHCPLSDEVLYCPVARSIAEVVPMFQDVLSHDEVNVTVTTEERTVVKRTAAQRAIGSLMGVLFATSGCPHTHFLKPMARYHLPFASEDETVFRVAGMYFLSRYFEQTKGESGDLNLEDLRARYDNLHKVNKGIADRIRNVSAKDVSINAVILLDLFTNLMPFVIQDELEDLRKLFTLSYGDKNV